MPLLNLRDVADGTGTVLRTGVLLRSAQPHALTHADTDLLAGLLGGPLEGLRLIADLRGEAERTGDDWAPLAERGVRIVRLGTSGSPADLSALPPGIELGDLYVLMLDHRTTWFASVVAEIADGLPALVHCAAGKDRTGLVVALILDLAGVDHDTIVRDYTATGEHLPQIMTMLGLNSPVTPPNSPTAPPASAPAHATASTGPAPQPPTPPSAEAADLVLQPPPPSSAETACPAPQAVPPHLAEVTGAVSGLLDAPEAAMRTFLAALDARGGAERLLLAHGLTEGHVRRLRTALVG
ncbi:tyrosine-protein phosphatase [Streptosporangium sp. NPDC051022]|uniref:tyrosine-protein phosphatase n=1 Tax=Streptosporangium sp. NPDC051022 TaxID=3155752 RepID=UPI00341AF6F0